MPFFLYRLLTIVLSPVLLGHILWKAFQHGQIRYLLQRCGFGHPAGNAGSLWFHCASVGEVNTLLPLLKHVHAQHPDQHFIITTNTITGASIVDRQQLDYLHHSYLPFDWSFSLRRFLRRMRPRALFILETEVWPNLIRQCGKADIPVSIINARLSSKTLNAGNFVKSLLTDSLNRVSLIASRSEQDSQGWLSLASGMGSDTGKIVTTGNLKLTTAIQPGSDSGTNFAPSRDYALLASTHEDEEKQFFDIWHGQEHDELLIIAPRHPERAESIIRQLKKTDPAIRLAQRSKSEACTEDTDVFLLDTVGELKNYFSNAMLVIMGGSFVPVGGHNILEPASYGCAIITGPYMENFRDELALMKDNKAILQLHSMQEMADCLSGLVDDEHQRKALADNTTHVAQDVTGILDRYAAIILAR